MDDKTMGILDHLDEFRRRLIVVLIVFVIFTIIGFIFVEDIYQYLIKDLNENLSVLSTTEILGFYFKIATVFGIAFTIPTIAYEFWAFVKPGLYEHERKAALPYIPGFFIFFIGGLVFGFFVIFPLIMRFLSNLGENMFIEMYTTEKYFSFVLNMSVPFGFLFEMPLIIMFLTSIGMINPYQLGKMRKYAYFILIVIAVTLSPPDFISDLVIAAPLLLLFEISVNIAKIVYRLKLRKEKKEAEKIL